MKILATNPPAPPITVVAGVQFDPWPFGDRGVLVGNNVWLLTVSATLAPPSNWSMDKDSFNVLGETSDGKQFIAQKVDFDKAVKTGVILEP